MFAFVLYYRIKRNEAVGKRLGDFHNRLARVTVDMGGSFYLPYRKCYSHELLRDAYPMISDFAKKKELYDPECLFSNLWFEHYILPLCSPRYREMWTKKITTKNAKRDICNNLSISPCINDNHLRRRDPQMLRRNNSYRNLLQSKKLRVQFKKQLLLLLGKALGIAALAAMTVP